MLQTWIEAQAGPVTGELLCWLDGPWCYLSGGYEALLAERIAGTTVDKLCKTGGAAEIARVPLAELQTRLERRARQTDFLRDASASGVAPPGVIANTVSVDGRQVQPDWQITVTGINAAWGLFDRTPGKLPWADIRVGHIDTGCTRHPGLGFKGDTLGKFAQAQLSDTRFAAMLADDGGIDPKWESERMTRATLPFPIPLSWDTGKSATAIRCHKLIAPLIEEVFRQIAALGLQGLVKAYGGCHVYRPKRNGVKPSTHSPGHRDRPQPEPQCDGHPRRHGPAPGGAVRGPWLDLGRPVEWRQQGPDALPALQRVLIDIAAPNREHGGTEEEPWPTRQVCPRCNPTFRAFRALSRVLGVKRGFCDQGFAAGRGEPAFKLRAEACP